MRDTNFMPDVVPKLRSMVLDTIDARALAEFYRALLGYQYWPGHECPAPGEEDPRGQDWLVLVDPGEVGAAVAKLLAERRPHKKVYGT